MKKEELIKLIDNTIVNEKIVDKVEELYGKIPNELKKVLSYIDEHGNEIKAKGCRFLSIDEILNTKKYLDVDFVKIHIIPIIDLFENDFASYDIKKGRWIGYNIVDDEIFEEYKDIKSIPFID